MDRTEHDINFVEDQVLVCATCGSKFTFTSGECRFYLSKGLIIPPRHCPECRRKRKLTINPDRTQSLDDFDAVMDKAEKEIQKEVRNE
jgi:hypothetical protein